MKKRHLFFTFILGILSLTNISAKDFETVLLKLDCTGFTGSAATEMMTAPNPYNWTAASGVQWTSEYCYAQNLTSTPHVGQSVRLGGTGGTGKATTPALDLSPVNGMETKLVIKVTAAADKTGSIQVKMDETILGTISASAGNGGSAFGAAYYTFTYPISNGTATSRISLIHSRESTNGNIYIQELKVIREPVTLMKMDCSAFVTTASTEMSIATAPHNWTTCFGQNLTSSFCYASNVTTGTTAYLGKCVRLGKTSSGSEADAGLFSLPALNLSAPANTKVKLYFELAVGGTKTDGINLIAKLNGTTELANIHTLSDGDAGDNATAFGDKWYEFDVEVSGGAATSVISFITLRSTISAPYIRNLRVYYEDASNTSVVAPAVKNNQVVVYPNPFADYITVSEPVKSLEIYNMSGQKLMQYNNVSSGIATSNLKSGNYIVKLVTGEGEQKALRIIKK